MTIINLIFGCYPKEDMSQTELKAHEFSIQVLLFQGDFHPPSVLAAASLILAVKSSSSKSALSHNCGLSIISLEERLYPLVPDLDLFKE